MAADDGSREASLGEIKRFSPGPPALLEAGRGIFVLIFFMSAAQAEPTREACNAAIGRARAAIVTLSPGSMAKRFAASDLVQAKAEAGNGEFDDCIEFAGKAEDEALHPHHAMTAPGIAAEPKLRQNRPQL